MELLDRHGTVQLVGDEIARGGEGSVYPLKARQDIVVKLYHLETLDKRGATLREKVDQMIGLRPQFATLPLAWPALAIYDRDGRWRGYAMRRLAGIPLSKLAHPMLGARHFPGLNRIEVVDMLMRIVATVSQMHAHGVRLGDINLHNFLFDHASGQVGVIDCDSFQLEMGGKVFSCTVGAPDMIPPEHHGQVLADVRRTVESDLFSLSILIFKCLMLGRHPYDFVGGSTVVENLKAGRFPYGAGGSAPGRDGAIPNGPWYLIWSHLSFDLKNLLIRTLSEGALNPDARAGTEEWLDALSRYRYGLNKGHHEIALRPVVQKRRQFNGQSHRVS